VIEDNYRSAAGERNRLVVGVCGAAQEHKQKLPGGGSEMKNVNFELAARKQHELKRMIEPLASYICASGRPRAALARALAALATEVEQTHRAARVHISALAGNYRS
jgi:hypothetical protein